MSLPTQTGNRLLPFNRDEPGSWQRWENFWVDFLNAEPLLPWPGEPTLFKRVKVAEKYGVAGGSQDGIDIRAYMDDGTILAVQCKDYARFDPLKGKAAMNKAEKEFTDAQAYLLVFTEKEVSAELQKEADRRGNWQVIGRDTLSSWFFAGKFLPPSEQKRLVRRHFGELWIRELFPLPSDDLLVSAERFFQQKNLIRHDAQLQGEASRALAESLATAMCGSGPRVAILTATGGQGKTRLLKTVAEFVKERSPQRNVRFQNDSADSASEDYGLRAEDFLNISIFIDDAHRLENLRSRLLRQISESAGATLLIAARPNSLESLNRKLLEAGFTESDWREYPLPKLGFEDRKAIATELLGEGNDELSSWLAEQSQDCPLICTVGADLFITGGIQRELIGSADFKRRVFDHLMDSSLDSLFGTDAPRKERAVRCLRILSMLSPVESGDELFKQIVQLEQCQPWEIDRLIPQLENAGFLRDTHGKIRVVPDLLADHLVYDTAYCQGKMPSLVREVISMPIKNAFASLFGNLAEAEWRAKQEGKAETYLDGMWESVLDLLRDPEDHRIFGLLDAWRKFAIFQPERTLKIARIILDHENKRRKAGSPEITYEGNRYDTVSLHLEKLPELLSPIAIYHRSHREEAIDVLLELGMVKDGLNATRNEIPAAWKIIMKAGSLAYWRMGGPQDTFKWLTKWAQRPEGRESLERGIPFVSNVALPWFAPEFSRNWMEGNAMVHQNQLVLPASFEGFRSNVLTWLEREVIPNGLKPCWSVLPVIYSASGKNSSRFRNVQLPPEEENARERLAGRSIELLGLVLFFHPDPITRLSIWQHLSGRIITEPLPELQARMMELRNSIPRDLSFQLARLASSFSGNEWMREKLKKRELEDYESANQWWPELARDTVMELRRNSESVLETMNQIDHLDRSLKELDQRASWDVIAEAWARQFPVERAAVLEELLENPARSLIGCLGYFLAARDEMNTDFAEGYALRALSHKDGKIRRSVLTRLSWGDVKRREPIAMKLREMASSQDAQIVSSIVDFISWNQYDATPYFDETLAALNTDKLSTEDLASLGASIANLVEYTEHTVSPDLLVSFFRRLEREEGDFQRIFPEQVMSVFHRKFPVEMLRVHLERSDHGRELPWTFDAWSLEGLAEHENFEALAREVLAKTLQAEDERFYRLRELFDAAVGRVNPRIAADLLAEHLDQEPLERIIKLTGCGHGSVVYHAPEFTRKLLMAISEQPALKTKELRNDLIFCSVPNSWGFVGEEIEEEYLWAKNTAAKLAEEFRADPCLRGFYLDIVKDQEQLAAQERYRIREEE